MKTKFLIATILAVGALGAFTSAYANMHGAIVNGSGGPVTISFYGYMGSAHVTEPGDTKSTVNPVNYTLQNKQELKVDYSHSGDMYKGLIKIYYPDGADTLFHWYGQSGSWFVYGLFDPENCSDPGYPVSLTSDADPFNPADVTLTGASEENCEHGEEPYGHMVINPA